MSGNFTEQDKTLANYILSPLDSMSFGKFLEGVAEHLGSSSLISISLPIEKIDPLACLELLDEGENYQYFWEKPSEEFAIAAGKALKNITARGKSRFKDIKDQITAINKTSLTFTSISHSNTGIHFLGGFSFFDDNINSNWQSFGSASFVIPEWQIIKEGQLTLLTLNFEASAFDNLYELKKEIRGTYSGICKILELNSGQVLSTTEKSSRLPDISVSRQAFNKWTDSVSQAKKLIDQRKFDKIVLARKARVAMPDQLQPTHIINALREQYPNCYSFLIRQKGSKTFLGCTPERLLSFRKNYALTEALAGSIQRGTTATEDAILEKELMHSAKNADEHNYVIKEIEQRLAPLVRKIERGTKPVIKKLTNVQHLFTPITAWLNDDIDPLTILEHLHPTPAVGGYPWKEAEPYVKELEHFDRGWYAGPVGWLNCNNGGEFAVAIRSGLVDKKHADFYAGCGIVADSDAADEWEETVLKLTPMLSVLQYD